MDQEITITDALGNPVVIGNLYGYSRNDSGWSHVTVGRVISASKDKVRLTDCAVKRYMYGEPSDFRADQKPADVSIRSNMVFPVSENK